MKIASTSLVGILAFSIAGIASADKLVGSLRLAIDDSMAIRSLGKDVPSRVVFTGKPILATVTFTVGALPSDSSSSPELPLPSARWWNDLRWDVRRDGQTSVVALKPERIAIPTSATSEKTALRPGERVTTKLSIGALPPGAYTLRIRLGTFESEPYRLLVSTGDENPDMRREFARYKTLHSPDTPTLKRDLLALAAADPLNAGVWIRLGDLSLGDGTPADVVGGYYDHALSIMRQLRSQHAARAEDTAVSAIDSEYDVIAQVRELIPRVASPDSKLRLSIDSAVERHYVVIDRQTGSVVQVIRNRANRQDMK